MSTFRRHRPWLCASAGPCPKIGIKVSCRTCHESVAVLRTSGAPTWSLGASNGASNFIRWWRLNLVIVACSTSNEHNQRFQNPGLRTWGVCKYCKNMIFGRSGKNIFWNICFSGFDFMNVGRSREVPNVVWKVWGAWNNLTFKEYDIYDQNTDSKITKKSKNGIKSFSNGPNLMMPGLGSMKTPQISVSTWNSGRNPQNKPKNVKKHFFLNLFCNFS